MPVRPINYKDYTVDAKDISSLDEELLWKIGNNEYRGTLKDFIETVGINKRYYWVCSKCGCCTTKLGYLLVNGDTQCKGCKAQDVKDRKEELYRRREEKKRVLGENKKSLTELIPDIESCWGSENEELPSRVFVVNAEKDFRKYYVVCPLCGEVFTKQVNSMLRTGVYCASCHRMLSCPEEKTLAYLYPEIAKRYDDSNKNKVSSNKIAAGSNLKAWFKCSECKRVFDASPNSMVRSYNKGHSGCPYCAGIKVHRDINSILAKNPPSTQYWDYDKNGDDPGEVIYSDQHMRWFKCEKGHSFQRTPFRMLKSYSEGGRICPICSGKEVLYGYNDVKTKNPLAYREWDYEKNEKRPEEVYYKSDVPYYFKCEHGHSYRRAMSGMLRSYLNGNEGCVVCSGKQVLPGFNDLKTLFPDIVEKYWSYEYNNYYDPSEMSPYSGKLVYWKCVKCGGIFEQNPDLRIRGLGYCPDCREEKGISIKEVELFNEVSAVCPDAISQYSLDGWSFDICVPSKNYLIEFNGLYWHSNAVERHKYRNTHLEKLQYADRRGYKLFVVWEDDWDYNREVCLNSLFSRLGVLSQGRYNARDCVVVEESSSSGVLSRTHLQGDAPIGCRYLKLRDGYEVVSELAYRVEGNKVNIVRYGSVGIVRGGFTKLLSALKEDVCKEKGVDLIYTFSDNAVSKGNLYAVSGFVFDRDIPPDYTLLYKDKRIHKFNFRKERFMSDDSLKYVDGLTEQELEDLNEIHRIWDYGKKKWVLYLKGN